MRRKIIIIMLVIITLVVALGYSYGFFRRRAYCCDQCRDAQLAAWKAAQQKARQQNLKADRPQFPERVCVICGETYTPRMPKQLTCCPDCGKEHRRRRMRIYRQKRQAEEA